MSASSADIHQKITDQYGISDDLPCADFALLLPLKRSSEYRAIRPRVAELKPADAWQEEGLHFFVFPLLPAEGAAPIAAEAPVAVFTMHPEEPEPISAVVVTPSTSGAEAEVVDLRKPESAYTAPYAPASALRVTASKTRADAECSTILLTGGSVPGASLQWQRFDTDVNDWVNISGAVSETLVYSSFEADAKNGHFPVNFTIGADSYQGQLFEVQLRLHASLTVNGALAEGNSPVLTVRKVKAVIL